MILAKTDEVIPRSAAVDRHSDCMQLRWRPSHRKRGDMRLLPSMFNATPSEVAACRAHTLDRYQVPPDAPADKVETAFERLPDLIVSYLSSPVPSAPDPPCRVGACITCGKDDCFATAEPWAAKLVYLDGEAHVSGGLCCERPWAKGHRGRCAHPMVEIQPAALNALLCCWIPEFHTPTSIRICVR